MGDVERQLIIDVAAGGAFEQDAVEVDEEVAAKLIGFSGDGIVAEADDVGGVVFTEVFAVGLGDAFVVEQHDGDFAPWVGGGFSL